MSRSVALVLCVMYLSTVAAYEWYNEIVSGEHFDDLVATTDGQRKVSRKTILVIHRPNCKPMVTSQELPPIAYLFFLRYDTSTAASIWYNPLDTDDLSQRYVHDGKCMTAMFFPRGVSIDARPVYWDRSEQVNLADWAWDCIQVNLTFENAYRETLIIMQYGPEGAPERKAKFIYAGETIKVQSYPGYNVYVRLTDRKTDLYHVVTGENNKKYTIKKYMREPDNERIVQQHAAAEKFYDNFMEMHCLRMVQMMKQPVFVHNYTADGYKKMNMPPVMYSLIKDFFTGRYEDRRSEGITERELIVINKNEVPPMMVDLKPELIKQVNVYLKPILEEWCNCELKFNVAYGIREYYGGNVLHKHVDNVITHVISALIQVDQQLKGDDWLLEVIKYDGSRKEIQQNAGEMILYESARLIHGRPKPFQGSRYANCFFHFSPVEGWDYNHDESILRTGERPWTENLRSIDFHEDSDLYMKTEL